MENNARLKTCMFCGGHGRVFKEVWENCGKWVECNNCVNGVVLVNKPWRPYPEQK